ncbi:facilitated trehalose transporter Tret1 [Cephus cinctus]|uniref:Facilitated trehalose transporter Tret1 n=1 Tax=Cephus cinctus TaxID=211228 RepID=A0AAJ7FFP7_CEPCN|nr:facilitated trehalose transporter Tret1 [Cephus cinctus]
MISKLKFVPSTFPFWQLYSAVTASLVILSVGFAVGWTSPASNQLSLNDSQFSWVISSYLIGSIMINVINPLYIYRISRKKALLLGTVPMTVGWLVLSIEDSFGGLCIGRVLTGVSTGILITSSIFYLAELADKRYRGAISAFLCAMLALGEILVHSCSLFATMNDLSTIALIPVGLFILGSFKIIESPYFDTQNGHEEKALVSLRKLRPYYNEEEIDQELVDIRNYVDGADCSYKKFPTLFSTRVNRRSILIVVLMKFANKFSGSLVVSNCTERILNLAEVPLDPALAVIITDCFYLVSVMLASSLLDRVGRRPLYIVSGILTSLVLVILATFFVLFDAGYDVTSFTWLPILCVGCYYMAVFLGILTLPYIVVAELFPTEVKFVAASLADICGGAFDLIMVMTMSQLLRSMSLGVIFYIFAVCTLVSSTAVFFILPETKGKSLTEVQEMLHRIHGQSYEASFTIDKK